MNIETKLLSIIIPVFNVEKYLNKCLDNLINQCDERIEILLIDDGSTDMSGKICDEYEKQFPLLIKAMHKSNGGLSSARNAGILCANGEYLYFLDSDDRVTDRFINDLKPKMESKKYDIIEFNCCWEKSNTYNLTYKNTEHILSAKESIENILKNKIGNQIWLRIYKSNLFDNVLFPEGHNYEDIATLYKLVIQAKNIIHIDSDYYIYNITNENSITKKTSLSNMEDMYKAVNELYAGLEKFCQENKIEKIYLEYYKRHSYIYILFKLLECDENVNELKFKILKYLKKNNNYNWWKYRYYDLKRWIYFQILLMLKKL